MPRSAVGRSLLLPLLLVAALAGLASLVVFMREGHLDPDRAGDPAGTNPKEIADEGGEPYRDPAELVDAERSSAPAFRVQSEPSPPSTLLCLHHGELRPISGIRLYAGTQGIAGPSAADGILKLEAPMPPVVTIWGEGWNRLELPSSDLPERVLLVPADGELEVRLANRRPEHRVARCELQPYRPSSAPDGPWVPRLLRRSDDLFFAEKVTPGLYDVYFWVSLGGGAPRPFEARRVKVLAGERAEVTLDLASTSPTHDEDS